MGNTPQWGVAHPPGGQRPISLEYQIYLPAIDTIVTGMVRGGVAGQKSRDLVGSDQPGAAAAGHWTAHWLLHIRVHQEFLLLRSIAVVDLVSFKRELGETSFSG